MNGMIGRRKWTIAEGYIPGWSHGPEPEITSHETACILNATNQDAHVEIRIYFADREPILKSTDYASVIESDVPIVVQHTRLDSRQADNALITTIAYADA